MIEGRLLLYLDELHDQNRNILSQLYGGSLPTNFIRLTTNQSTEQQHCAFLLRLAFLAI